MNVNPYDIVIKELPGEFGLPITIAEFKTALRPNKVIAVLMPRGENPERFLESKDIRNILKFCGES